MGSSKTRSRAVKKYDIELSRTALKHMQKIPKKDLIKIRDRIELLSQEPLLSGVKKIEGDDNLFRTRVGDWRILYRIFESVLQILIVDIDHRKDIYKQLR